jgi:hypothetical protein
MRLERNSFATFKLAHYRTIGPRVGTTRAPRFSTPAPLHNRYRRGGKQYGSDLAAIRPFANNAGFGHPRGDHPSAQRAPKFNDITDGKTQCWFLCKSKVIAVEGDTQVTPKPGTRPRAFTETVD